jgi:TusA-related sulfurtransferase
MDQGQTTRPVRELDLRFLEPPEPFVQTMDALETLQPGDCLRILLYREPVPLYRVLDQHGYERHTEVHDDGTYAILITRRR